MSNKKLLFVFRQPPKGSALAQEALDVLLMASTQQHTISVVFIGDGVWQLKTGQEKNFTAAYKALPLYDVNQVFVDHTSLQTCGLTQNDLILNITALDNKAIAELMQQNDVIFNF